MEKNPEFKCKYCGTTMEFREHRKGDAWDWMSYFCPKCGSTGPVASNNGVCPDGMSRYEVRDESKKWLDRSMIGFVVRSKSKADVVRDMLQSASGRYAAMKALDLPEAEGRVKEAYRLFKFDSVRPKDLDFRAWVREMSKSTARLARALDSRATAIKKFQAVKSDMRRLQRELRDEKRKEEAGDGAKA